jgi:hypothetical protein
MDGGRATKGRALVPRSEDSEYDEIRDRHRSSLKEHGLKYEDWPDPEDCLDEEQLKFVERWKHLCGWRGWRGWRGWSPHGKGQYIEDAKYRLASIQEGHSDNENWGSEEEDEDEGFY